MKMLLMNSNLKIKGLKKNIQALEKLFYEAVKNNNFMISFLNDAIIFFFF